MRSKNKYLLGVFQGLEGPDLAPVSRCYRLFGKGGWIRSLCLADRRFCSACFTPPSHLDHPTGRLGHASAVTPPRPPLLAILLLLLLRRRRRAQPPPLPGLLLFFRRPALLSRSEASAPPSAPAPEAAPPVDPAAHHQWSGARLVRLLLHLCHCRPLVDPPRRRPAATVQQSEQFEYDLRCGATVGSLERRNAALFDMKWADDLHVHGPHDPLIQKEYHF